MSVPSFLPQIVKNPAKSDQVKGHKAQGKPHACKKGSAAGRSYDTTSSKVAKKTPLAQFLESQRKTTLSETTKQPVGKFATRRINGALRTAKKQSAEKLSQSSARPAAEAELFFSEPRTFRESDATHMHVSDNMDPKVKQALMESLRVLVIARENEEAQ